MNLSKERRIYVAILGLGLAGVAVDRLWLQSGPSAVSASMLPGDSLAVTPQAESPKSTRMVPVSRRLDELSRSTGEAGVQDAFVVPAAWQPVKVAEKAAEPTADEPTAEPPQAKGFAGVITSIIGRGENLTVLIDGEVVCAQRPSKLTGMRLVSVVENMVTITRDGQEYTLEYHPRSASEKD